MKESFKKRVSKKKKQGANHKVDSFRREVKALLYSVTGGE